MAKQKAVTREHVAFLKTYFSKKLAEDDGVSGLLEDADRQEAAEADLKRALEEGKPQVLNNWFDEYLSKAGRRIVWTAFRNVEYRERNPRNAQELRMGVTRAVMEWAERNGIDNLNDAVLALLEAQNPK